MAGEVISQPGGTEREGSGPRQSADRRAPNFEPTQDEQTVVGNWLSRVKRAEEAARAKKWRENLEKLRRYERGEQTVDDKKSRTNMVYATIAVQMPKLYAKNPVIAVTPTDAVGKAKLPQVKAFCATAEKVIRKMLVEEGKLKKRAKANIRATMVTGFGVLKVLYQTEYRGDPIAVRRLEDSQDNLARVEGLIQQMKKTDDPSELARKRDELRANLAALKADNEIRIFKGFTIDRVKSEDFLILDDNVSEFDEYAEAAALGHEIWKTVADARDLFGMEPTGATRYGRPRSDNTKTDDTPEEDQFICVIEIWDKKNGVVRTTAKGMNRWLREPYAPRHVPQRWYPFYVLGFNVTEGEWQPIPDTEMLSSLQDEYDRTRQNYADVREKAVPKRIVRKGGNLTEDDVTRIVDSGNKDWVAVEGNPAVPITQDVMQLEGLKIDPAAYDTSAIRDDMDVVAGLSDAGRSNLIEAKTATEAEIMNEAMQSRQGERRDTHEDLLSEMGEGSLETALQDLSLEEVRQIAGDDAVWPDTPQGAEETFRQVSVKVRAGSSGKPNQQREREQWAQLLPLIKETMTGVMELRAAGNLDMANAAMELMRETLRRYDENFDLDALLPPMDEDGMGAQMQQLAAELTKCKEALAAAQEESAKTQEALAKAQQGEQAKAIEAQAKAEAQRQEQARKDAEALFKQDMEKQEFARRDRLEADQVARDERLAKAKLENERTVRTETEKIRARQTDDDQARRVAETEGKAAEVAKRDASEARMAQLMEALNATIAAMRQSVDALRGATVELSEVNSADRVPVYGKDGMPERVRVERKKKPAGAIQ